MPCAGRLHVETKPGLAREAWLFACAELPLTNRKSMGQTTLGQILRVKQLAFTFHGIDCNQATRRNVGKLPVDRFPPCLNLTSRGGITVSRAVARLLTADARLLITGPVAVQHGMGIRPERPRARIIDVRVR